MPTLPILQYEFVLLVAKRVLEYIHSSSMSNWLVY